MRTVIIIQARLASTRLPGKVLYELSGLPMIAFMIRRVERTAGVQQVVLAISEEASNAPLADIAGDLGISVFRGSETDLLGRYRGAAEACRADLIVRLTGDCPLADPEVVASVIALRNSDGLDYATNVHPPTWPDGLDVSVFTRDALERAHREARLPSEREHVVPWMWRNSSLEGGRTLTAGNLACPETAADLRWTLDDASDYLMLRALARAFGPRLAEAGWRDILTFVRSHPSIARINATGIRDAGLAKSRAEDAHVVSASRERDHGSQ